MPYEYFTKEKRKHDKKEKIVPRTEYTELDGARKELRKKVKKESAKFILGFPIITLREVCKIYQIEYDRGNIIKMLKAIEKRNIHKEKIWMIALKVLKENGNQLE